MTLSIDEVKVGVVREHDLFADFIEGLTDEEWNTPSRCEGWTVADVAAHVVGGIADVAAGNFEGLGTPEVTQREVDERRGKSPGELAQELRDAMKVNQELLSVFDEAAWNSPSPGGFEGTTLQGVEALYYDAYLHADDIRAAIGRGSERGEGLRCAVHHVAFELQKRSWPSATLALEGVEEITIGGGGDRITGDPLAFVLAVTGRGDPAAIGLDASVNIYAD
ncbi:MAG: maleylpyruvate isomerase family mycothiol-dependent enzyme [Actinobacteria bacterium]|nr:maleylpyruvate isomerase family mycothiol-dependent enzyme [Actinomycetota bacterium]